MTCAWQLAFIHKAFDCLSQEILLFKLAKYSFDSNRERQTTIDIRLQGRELELGEHFKDIWNQ